MAVQIIVPAEGGIENCIISKWARKTGDQVFMGDLLCEVETDKAIVDIVAPIDGYLLSILYEEGDEVPVLAPIATIGTKDEIVGEM